MSVDSDANMNSMNANTDHSEAIVQKLKFKLEKTQGDLDRANGIIQHLSEHIRLNYQDKNEGGVKEKSMKSQFNPELIIRMATEINTLKQRLASQANQSSSTFSCTSKTSAVNSHCATVSWSSNEQLPITPIVQTRARNKEAFDKLQEEICHLRYQFRRRVSCGPRPSFGRLSNVHSKSIPADAGCTSCSIGVEVSEGDTRHKLDFSEELRRDSFLPRSADDLLMADLLAESEGRGRIMRDRLEEFMTFWKTLLDNSELSAVSKGEASKISNCLSDTSYLLEDFSLWVEERKEILENSSTSESRKSLAARASLIGRPSLFTVLEADEPIEDGDECHRIGFDPARCFNERSPVTFFQGESETWRSKITESEDVINALSIEISTLRSSLKEAESSISQLNTQLHEESLHKQAVSERLQELENDTIELSEALRMKESIINKLTFENADLKSELECFEQTNARKLALVTADLEITKRELFKKEEEVQSKTKKLMEAEYRVVEFQTNYENLDHKLNILVLERDSLLKRLEDEKAVFEMALGTGKSSATTSSSQNLLALMEVERMKLLKTELDCSHVTALEEKNQSLELKLENQSAELTGLSQRLKNLDISSPMGQQQAGLCCANLKEELELLKEERDVPARKVVELSRKSSLLTSEIVSSSSSGSEVDVSFCGLKKCQDRCNRLERYIYELKELLAKNTCVAEEMREQLHVLNTELKQKKLTINRLETSLKEAQSRSSLGQQWLLPKGRVGDRGAGESNFSNSQEVIDELQKLNKMLKMELILVRKSKSARTAAISGNSAMAEGTTGSDSAENKENIKLVDVDTPDYALKTSLQDVSSNSNNNNDEDGTNNDHVETDWFSEVARIRSDFQELVESNQELRQQLEKCSKSLKTTSSCSSSDKVEAACSVACDHSRFYREIEGLKRQIAELRSLQPRKNTDNQSKPRDVQLRSKINQSEVIKEINTKHEKSWPRPP